MTEQAVYNILAKRADEAGLDHFSPHDLRRSFVSDMLDAAFRLYRQHFLTFIGIVALLQVPMAILQFLLQYAYGNSALTSWVNFISRLPAARRPRQERC